MRVKGIMKKSFLQKIRNYITKGKCDFYVLLLVVILVIFGVVMVFSASYYKSISESGTPYGFLKRQLLFAVVGSGLMYVASKFDYHIYQRHYLFILGVCMALLLAVLTPLGTTVNGATRWIYIGPLSLMPGEIAKFGAVICTSAFLAEKPGRISSFKDGILYIFIFMLATGFLIFKQPNLSTALTVEGIIAGIMFIEGLQLTYIGGGIAAGILGIIVLVQSGTYWSKRLISFTNPFKYADGDGFQAVQSLLALGSGGLFGLGLGQSVQKNLYLPEPQNDFISAIIGEELGLLGLLVLMIVYMILVWRCALVAMRSKDKFGMLIASGVSIMIGLQVILNIAVVTSSMPPTGIALPFVSYGGNTLWIFMILLGIVLNISRYDSQNQRTKEKKTRKIRTRVKLGKRGTV